VLKKELGKARGAAASLRPSGGAPCGGRDPDPEGGPVALRELERTHGDGPRSSRWRLNGSSGRRALELGRRRSVITVAEGIAQGAFT
jgi:hypothetical protein